MRWRCVHPACGLYVSVLSPSFRAPRLGDCGAENTDGDVPVPFVAFAEVECGEIVFDVLARLQQDRYDLGVRCRSGVNGRLSERRAR